MEVKRHMARPYAFGRVPKKTDKDSQGGNMFPGLRAVCQRKKHVEKKKTCTMDLPLKTRSRVGWLGLTFDSVCP